MKRILLILIAIITVSHLQAQEVVMQDGMVSQCTGTFTDSGGSSGTYSSNENLTFTLCPDIADSQMVLDFTAFSTQQAVDVMTIYDGDDNTAPIIGVFSGVNSPGNVMASNGNPSGCLTIEFESNATGNGFGWEAGISCFGPCQTITTSIDDVSPSDFDGTTYEVILGDNVQFMGSATFSDNDPTGAVFNWDFGDGNSGVGATTTHTYLDQGMYTVTLTIDQNGCMSDPITVPVNVIFDPDAQEPPGCPNVDAGADIVLDCDSDCVDLTASFFDTGETTSYAVDQIPYAPPFPFDGGIGVSVGIDDRWSQPIQLPFEFCFYGENYTEMLVGSNGVVTFDFPKDGQQPDMFCDYSFNQTLPSTDLFSGTIFGAYMDIDPSINGSGEINYAFFGEAPCRTLVVSFPEVPYFSCSNLTMTSQIVIYETTNIVEVYIENRSDGCSFNNGNAVIGLQNQDQDQAITPPGRNTGDWAATNEAWRFTPNGTSNVVFSWLDSTGAEVSNTQTLQVCPSDPSETYTAQAIYTSCDGDEIVVTDEVVVSSLNATIGNLESFTECSNDNTATFEFDLTQNDDNALGTQDPNNYTVTYHETQAAADAGTPVIPNPDMYTNTTSPQTIYVRVTNNAEPTTCYSVETFTLNVSPTPVANMAQNLEFCGDGTEPVIFDLTENDDDVLGGQNASDFEISYFASQADADAGMPVISNPTVYSPSANPETIFVRIEDATSGNCYDTASFTISSFTAEVGLLDDLTQCDNGTPDTSLFDLTENELNALNGQDPNDFTVTYHTTQANADAGTPSILTPNAYLNTANPELIYVRVENNLNVDCYDTGRFSLIVNVQPIANEPQDIELCSTGGGITFDLTENDDDVLGAQTASDVTITYHESQADADLGTPIIPNATSYTAGSNPQTIFVRIEDANSGECFDTNSFVISSFEVSIGELEDFAQCESDGPGTSTFDLTQNDDEALNGQDPNNYTVTYHSSQADADNDVVIAGDPTAYQNTSNPQTIFVRVEENSSVDCFVTDTFTLTVNDTPIANMPPNLEQCSTGGPSQLFDLTQVEGDVLGGQDATQFSITYHNSQADADANTPIVEDPTAYPNMSNPETIFVRIENNIDSSCYDTTSFQLIVNDRPSVAAAPQDLEECEDAMGNAFFNLETNTPLVLGAQDPNSYDVTYYESQLDADTPNAPIGNTTNYTALSNPQIIYIRIQNTASPECYETVSFQIESFSVAIGEPDDLFACDEGTGGFAEFNLTNNDNSVLAGQDPFLYTVTYHDTQAGADTNDASIPDPTAYTNTTNPQTVFVRVENDENTTCYLTASFQLETTPSAPIQDPEPLEVCDTDNDGFSEFDLDSTSNGIALGNPDLVVTFHPTQ
ncbi:PKD domain-containing protein, partial [Croceibacter atlanticus]|uniref:PKD domain-containing protein n=1 Tax=Croceibacter atlanticus TaxID=313588 RepID=UPI0030D7DAD6